MESLTKVAWGLVAMIHVMPTVVLFMPEFTHRMYGILPKGDVGILIVHRGALFLALIATALFAMFDPGVRRASSVIVAISVIGFLFVYARAGMPTGSLRAIAQVDLIALLPLGFVTWQAWLAQPNAA